MASKSWKLMDAADGTYVEATTIGPKDVGGSVSGYSIEKQRYRGGLRDGVEYVRVSTGSGFAFDVLPTRGMGIWKAWLHGEEIGWNSPVSGPVHPSYVPLMEPSGLGWLEGFDELLVRCGLESNGAPDFDENGRLLYPLHGRIANRPANKLTVAVDGESGEIAVTGVVDEVRFHFIKARLTSTISTRVGEAGFRVHDVVENLSASPAEIQMLYHTNFGQPLLDAGSQFVAPAKKVVPRNDHAAGSISGWNRYAAEVPGFEEQVYFLELLANEEGRTRTLLKNAHGTHGVSMIFDTKQLPCFTVWKNTTAAADGYVTGLEPGTNFPNPRSFEGQQGRVAKLEGGESIIFDLQLEFHDKSSEVDRAEQAITELQGDTATKVHDGPLDRWCAP